MKRKTNGKIKTCILPKRLKSRREERAKLWCWEGNGSVCDYNCKFADLQIIFIDMQPYRHMIFVIHNYIIHCAFILCSSEVHKHWGAVANFGPPSILTLMSLQRLLEVWVLKNPSTPGLLGSVTSTNEVPTSQPTNAYSLEDKNTRFQVNRFACSEVYMWR